MEALDALDGTAAQTVDNTIPQQVHAATTDTTMVEDAVRAALALFGVDYDSYITYTPDSAYAMALAANPALVEHITSSPMPVVEALKVALAYQPYAEFARKYGTSPEAIREAIRQELEAERAEQAPKEVPEQDTAPHSRTPVFSAVAGAAAPKAAGSDTKNRLDSLFNRR
jgi:hypothetical protein